MGRNVGAVNEFLGIPYAEPPIGKLRFRPTRPTRHWQSKLYNATQFSPECLQSTLFAGESDNRPNDEDCLYLNIWQPVSIARKNSKENNSKYPVLIWIYGGAFVHGGSSLPEYYGNKLAARGVVVVSFNYRLGALGFLVSTADGLFGNYGLDDQKTAIQWVQDHIASFGGDPDRVTLCGESAGAMSIGLHVLDQQYRMDTPISDVGENILFHNKLFHAAILQSNPMGYK
jgi:para-nitrobenzyl esterase